MYFKLKGDNVTEGELSTLIHSFVTAELPRRRRLYDYYGGQQGVNKGRVAPGRPNNALTANFAKYITDVQTGYFMGIPPTYELESRIADTVAKSGLQTSLFSAARDMSICGEGYVMTYLDTGGTRVCRLDPLETLVLSGSGIGTEPVAAIRLRHCGSGVYSGELYMEGYVQSIEYDGREAVLGARVPLILGGLCVSRFCNNEGLTGDFEPVISLLDAYNLLLSGSMDDMQSVANAFLALYGMQGTTQGDIDRANLSRVLSLSENGRAEFVVKNLNSDAISLLKRTLLEDILLITMTPNLNDESFGSSSSGVALEYKLWGIEQARSAKERGFSPGLYHVLSLIIGGAALDGICAPSEVKAQFYKNLPRDLTSICQNIERLSSVVSQETLLSLLPFVENPKEELLRLGREKNEAVTN